MPIYYFLIYAHQSFSTFPFSIYDGCTCINSIMKLDWPTKIFPFYSNSLQKFPNLFKSNSNYFQFPHLVATLLFDPYTIWLVLASQERIKRVSYFILLFIDYIFFWFFLYIFFYFLIFNLVGPGKNRVFTVAPLYLLVAKKSELLVYEASKDKNTYFVRPDNRRKTRMPLKKRKKQWCLALQGF